MDADLQTCDSSGLEHTHIPKYPLLVHPSRKWHQPGSMGMLGKLPMEVRTMIYEYLFAATCAANGVEPTQIYENIEQLQDDGTLITFRDPNQYYRVIVKGSMIVVMDVNMENLVFGEGMAVASKLLARTYLSVVLPKVVLQCYRPKSARYVARALTVIFGDVQRCTFPMTIQLFWEDQAYYYNAQSWSERLPTDFLEELEANLDQLCHLPLSARILVNISQPCKDLIACRRLFEERDLFKRPRLQFATADLGGTLQTIRGCMEVSRSARGHARTWSAQKSHDKAVQISCRALMMAAMSGVRLSGGLTAYQLRLLDESGVVGVEEFVHFSREEIESANNPSESE